MLLLHLSNRIGLSVDMIMESYRKLLRESEACVFLRLFSSTTLPQGKRKDLLLRENLFLRNLHLVSGWTCYRESLGYLFFLGHQWMPPSSPWWWGPLWEENYCSLMLGFPELHNIAIHFHLRTENCLEKTTVETQSLILASAQRDHLSCFYGKLVSAWIWLEVLSNCAWL